MSEKSTKLKVEGLPQDVTDCQLSLLLSNNQRQGGGPIESIELTEDTAIVTFVTNDAVDIILGRGNTVQLNDLPVRVSRYFDPDDTKSSMKPCRSISAKGKISAADEDQELPLDDLSDGEDLPEKVKKKSLKDAGKKKATAGIKKQQSVPDEEAKMHRKKSKTYSQSSDDEHANSSDEKSENESSRESKSKTQKSVKEKNKNKSSMLPKAFPVAKESIEQKMKISKHAESQDELSESESQSEKPKNSKHRSLKEISAKKKSSVGKKTTSDSDRDSKVHRKRSTTHSRTISDDEESLDESTESESSPENRERKVHSTHKKSLKKKKSSVVKKISDSENSEEEHIEEPEKPWNTTIKAKVSDITKTKDFYVMYFEDPHISQGQFYEESFLLDGLNKILYLTFCDRKAAVDTVHFKHKPESNLQEVEMAAEDDFNTHSNLISVHGYYCSTAEQKKELKKNLEDITKMEVMSIVQQDEPRSAIIVFNPNSRKDISAVTWIPFNFGNVRLIVAPVFKTNWVKVTGIHNLSSDDTVQCYMSNVKCSGGGEITFFQRLSKSEACINFKESKSVDGLIAKNPHSLEGGVLLVSSHYPCLSTEVYKTHVEPLQQQLMINTDASTGRQTESLQQVRPREGPETARPFEIQSRLTFKKVSLYTSIDRASSKKIQYVLKLCKFGYEFLKRQENELIKQMQLVHCQHTLDPGDNTGVMYLTLNYPHTIKYNEVINILDIGLSKVIEYLDTFTVAEFSVVETYKLQQYYLLTHQNELLGFDIFFDHLNNMACVISKGNEHLIDDEMNKMYHKFMTSSLCPAASEQNRSHMNNSQSSESRQRETKDSLQKTREGMENRLKNLDYDGKEADGLIAKKSRSLDGGMLLVSSHYPCLSTEVNKTHVEPLQQQLMINTGTSTGSHSESSRQVRPREGPETARPFKIQPRLTFKKVSLYTRIDFASGKQIQYVLKLCKFGYDFLKRQENELIKQMQLVHCQLTLDPGDNTGVMYLALNYPHTIKYNEVINILDIGLSKVKEYLDTFTVAQFSVFETNKLQQYYLLTHQNELLGFDIFFDHLNNMACVISKGNEHLIDDEMNKMYHKFMTSSLCPAASEQNRSHMNNSQSSESRQRETKDSLQKTREGMENRLKNLDFDGKEADGLIAKKPHSLDGGMLLVSSHYPSLNTEVYKTHVEPLQQQLMINTGTSTGRPREGPETARSFKIQPRLTFKKVSLYTSIDFASGKQIQYVLKLCKFGYDFLKRQEDELIKQMQLVHCQHTLDPGDNTGVMYLTLNYPHTIKYNEVINILDIGLSKVKEYLDTFTVAQFSVFETNKLQQYYLLTHQNELLGFDIFFDHLNNMACVISKGNEHLIDDEMNKMYHKFMTSSLCPAASEQNRSHMNNSQSSESRQRETKDSLQKTREGMENRLKNLDYDGKEADGLITKKPHSLDGGMLLVSSHYPSLSIEVYKTHVEPLQQQLMINTDASTGSHSESSRQVRPRECPETARSFKMKSRLTFKKVSLYTRIDFASGKQIQYVLKLCKFGYEFLKRQENELIKQMQLVHCQHTLDPGDNTGVMYLTLNYPHTIKYNEVINILDIGLSKVIEYLDTFTVVQFSVVETYKLQQYYLLTHQNELLGFDIFFDHLNNLVCVIISKGNEHFVEDEMNRMCHKFMTSSLCPAASEQNRSHMNNSQSSESRQRQTEDSLQNTREGMENTFENLDYDGIQAAQSVHNSNGLNDTDKKKKPSFPPRPHKGKNKTKENVKNEFIPVQLTVEKESDPLEEKDIIMLEKTLFHKDLEKNIVPLQIILNTEKMCIIIKSNDMSKIIQAELELYKKMRDFTNIDVTSLFSPQQLQYLSKQEVQNKINDIFLEMKYHADLRCRNGTVTIYHVKDVNTKLLKDVAISQATAQKKPLDKDMALILQSEKGHKFLADICEINDGVKVISQVKLEDNCQHIVSPADQLDIVLKAVDYFVEENKSFEKSIPFSSGKQKFVKKCFSQDLAQISNSLIPLGARIVEHSDKYTVQGLKDGVTAGEKKLSQLSEKILVQEVTLKYFGIKEFLQTPEGESLLTRVENTQPCVILPTTALPSGQGYTTFSSKQLQPQKPPSLIDLAKVRDYSIMFHQGHITSLDTEAIVNPLDSPLKYSYNSGLAKAFVLKDRQENRANELHIKSVTVKIKKGDILSEKCDAIICAIRDTMDMSSSGAVSKNLLKKCGSALQDECNSKKDEMAQKGFTTTSAPNLNCQHIYYVSLDQFSRNWDRCISQVLADAENQGCKSVSIPALGAGPRRADYKQIKHSILKGVDYFARNIQKTLIDVRLVVFSEEMLDEFLDEGDSPRQAAHGQEDDSLPTVVTAVSDHADLKIYSDSQTKIYSANKSLNDAVKSAFRVEKEKIEQLKRFSKQQARQLEDEGRKNYVKVTVTIEESLITMSSFNKDGILNIHKLLKIQLLAAEKAHNKSLLEAVQSAVVWQFEHEQWRNYDPIINSELESEYKKMSKHHDITDAIGRVSRVDFSTMKEFPLDVSGVPHGCGVNVRRYDRIKEGEPLPKQWDQMKSNENLKLVTLVAGSPEFKVAEQRFIQGGAGVPIKKIERIQNKSLYQIFKAKKREIYHRNPKGHKNEQRLFHGTDTGSVTAINETGFNRSYCGKNATAYGKGVYFAVQSSYSVNYARPSAQGECLMYIARVLTGESTPSSSDMRYLPNKPGTNIPYDSGTASTNKGAIFIIFHDTQAYPEYLITF